MKAGVRGGHLSHSLIDRNRVAVGRSEPAPSEPDLLAVVMVTEAAGVMQAADRRDDAAMLFQRLEGAGKAEVLTWRHDLIVEGVDAVGNVDEDASLGLRCRRRKCRTHTFKQRQGDEAAEAAENVPTVDLPRGCHEMAFRWLGRLVVFSGCLREPWCLRSRAAVQRFCINSETATARIMSRS